MQQIKRDIIESILKTLNSGKSVLLLGPRQTGKTTLALSISHDLYINLMNTRERQRYEREPALIIDEIRQLNKSLKRKPLVVVDEIQKIPELTDNLQILIDEGTANFIITGSSARKLKNLLPGRVIKFRMYPLSLNEIKNLSIAIEHLLAYGSLPGIIDIQDDLKQELLESYVNLYLEEEIRKEALVRNIGAFSNFLQLAAIESGQIVNMTKISQDVGVSHSTIAEYYQILIDCMVATKINPITENSSRRKLSKSPKYIMFDLGIRMLAAQDHMPSLKDLPALFEQFVGLEILKIINACKVKAKLCFWRDHAGPEVDYVLCLDEKYIPIEIKWSDKPSLKDARHLNTFLNEYANAEHGFIVCSTPREYMLNTNKQIQVISWQQIEKIFT